MGQRNDNSWVLKSEIRKKRTRLLIDTAFNGVDAALASAMGVQAAYVARFFTSRKEHRRNIGERMARRIEEAGGVPEGWLDRDDDAPTVSPSGRMRRLAPDTWELVEAYERLDDDQKGAVLTMVCQLAGRKPPSRRR